MLTHHDDHRRAIATFTTSRCINAAPRHLARAIQHPRLFRPPAADPQRPIPVAINLDPAPDGRGAVTLHCLRSGTSERRPLRTRHLSTVRLTAETGDGTAIRDASETPALALSVDLTPVVQPGPAIATRVTLSFHFVREPWWPRDLTDAMNDLANLWLQRLEEQAHATARSPRPAATTAPSEPGPSPFSRRSRPRQVSETRHV